MTTLEDHKKYLGTLFKQNGVKLKTKKAYEYAFFYYHGVYSANGLEMPAGVTIMLMSGRIEELVIMEDSA